MGKSNKLSIRSKKRSSKRSYNRSKNRSKKRKYKRSYKLTLNNRKTKSSKRRLTNKKFKNNKKYGGSGSRSEIEKLQREIATLESDLGNSSSVDDDYDDESLGPVPPDNYGKDDTFEPKDWWSEDITDKAASRNTRHWSLPRVLHSDVIKVNTYDESDKYIPCEGQSIESECEALSGCQWTRREAKCQLDYNIKPTAKWHRTEQYRKILDRIYLAALGKELDGKTNRSFLKLDSTQIEQLKTIVEDGNEITPGVLSNIIYHLINLIDNLTSSLGDKKYVFYKAAMTPKISKEGDTGWENIFKKIKDELILLNESL